MPLRENLPQAREDLEQARREAQARFHEWATLLAKEAAESALRILADEEGIPVPETGQLAPLARALQQAGVAGLALVEQAARIDELHDPVEVDLETASLAEREGGKAEYVDADDADEAIAAAKRIVDACAGKLEG